MFAAGGGVNYAFLVFPFVIYAAVRLGVAETAFALFWVMALMYGVLIAEAGTMDAARVNATLWFLQVYGFVLGASGLLLAALTADRETAEARLREERTRLLESTLREERARLDALRYQINPHFLFNSLNSICAVASEPAREMVGALAGYLRSTLTHPDIERVRLSDEFLGVDRYLAIESIRHGDALRVSADLAPELRDHPVPPFLLQPLVENALRHGFEQSKGVFHLEIAARFADAGIELVVANTGRWREGEAVGTGLGMDNVRRRLRLVYGEAAEMRVETDTPGWVRVRLILPLAVPA
ncbi:MAG: histidine kinase [Burkholderiales bacterium]|nr:histidine kinase [Opitutaceae bacterium]